MIPIPKSYEELVQIYGPVFKAMNIDLTTQCGIEKALRTYIGIDITSNKSVKSFIGEVLSVSIYKLIDNANPKFAEKLVWLGSESIKSVLKDPESQNKILECLIKIEDLKEKSSTNYKKEEEGQ